MSVKSVFWNASFLLLILFFLTVSNDVKGQLIELAPDNQGAPVPTAYASFDATGGILSDPNGIDVLVPPNTFAQQTTLALFVQFPIPTPRRTDVVGYRIVIAMALASSVADFKKNISVRVKYSQVRIRGIDESSLQGFYFDFVEGQWLSVNSVVHKDTERDLKSVTLELTQPTLFAIGGQEIGTGRILTTAEADANQPIPRLIDMMWKPSPTDIALLFAIVAILILVILPLIMIKRRKAQDSSRLTLIIVAIVGTGLLCLLAYLNYTFAAQPEVTNPGNKPINHTSFVSKTESPGKFDDKDVTVVTITYENWIYNTKTRPPQWDKVRVDERFIKERLVPTDIDGATPVDPSTGRVDRNYKDDYFKYDCAGFAFRSSGYIPSDPDIDGKVILENEYTKVANFKDLSSEKCPRRGDILTYKNGSKITHYAVVEEVDEHCKIKKVRSKWGRTYVYEHPPEKVPSTYGSPDEVWRKR